MASQAGRKLTKVYVMRMFSFLIAARRENARILVVCVLVGVLVVCVFFFFGVRAVKCPLTAAVPSP